MNKLSIIGLLLLFVLSSCRDDFDDTNTVTERPDPPFISSYEPEVQEVTASVRGYVTNEFGEPVEGATIEYNSKSTSTNEYGHFFIKNERMNAKGMVVQVKKEGYFDGNRRFFPTEGNESRINIQLIPKNLDFSFESSSGGEVFPNAGGRIIFSPNSIANSDGTPYDGEVKVAMHWLSPTHPATIDQMPGSLHGVSLQNEEVALATYGMMAVELEDINGNSLNILDGHTAEIRMPVPDPLLAEAPQTIPLWSFYEPYGLWGEEGEATLEYDAAINGYEYVGQVSHFSFWNCDYPYELIDFHARFIDPDGDPIVNVTVILSLTGSNSSAGADVTDIDGNVQGKVPANEEMALTMYNYCGDVIYTDVIGPFADDISLGDVTASGNGMNSVNLTGSIEDCDGNPITNAVLAITSDWYTTHEYVDGTSFDVNIMACQSATSIDIIAINPDSLVQSDPINIPVADTDLGVIEVCDVQLENYIQISAGGVTAVYLLSDSTYFSQDFTSLDAWGTANEYISVAFYGGSTGSYGNNNYAYISDSDYNWQFRQAQFETFEVTEYGAVGEPVKGYFSGTLMNTIDPQNPVSVLVTGEFSAIRK